MPKSRKKKNADFQKVKLKVGRRLPKGQNETTTNFKSRTIHITQQIKNAAQASEPQTKRKLVLKDLLPKCDHHNSRVRLTGVEGVTELVIAESQAVLVEMADIFKRVLPLLSDRDPLVRQAVLKLFRIIFANGELRKIGGFFPLLSTHLCCAMTHICDEVQQDSLQFFDLLLDNFPKDIVGNMSQLLIQIFIEQMSTQTSSRGGKGRTLVINPSSRQSSKKMRAKILERLKKLVDAFLSEDKSESAFEIEEVQVVHINDYPKVRGPLISPWVQRMWRTPYLSVDTSSHQDLKGNEYAAMLTDAGKLQKFVEQLLPLLKQCWAEVCPSSRGTNSVEQTDQKSLEKSLPLLVSVVGVLRALVECWIHFRNHKERTSCKPKDDWFRGTFLKELTHLLMPHFPLILSGQFQLRTEAQSSKLSPVQMSVLKLNLSIIEIMASFSVTGKDEHRQASEAKTWQSSIVLYLMDNIIHCTGSDLGKTVTAVLQKAFINFSPSKKLDKLLKKAHVQYRKAHPLSAEKRMYLTMFEALAFDEYSPYRDRLELLRKFFNSLPDLLLQLPTDSVQTAKAIIRIMQRGGQQNCQPIIAVLRQNVEKLFDIEKGVLASADPAVHDMICQVVYWLFRMDPPSAPQLKLFAQNCRLPQVSTDVTKTLISALDITFWHLNYDKAILLKPHQPRFMTFLTGMISGHTKEETEELQVSSWPRVPSLVGIVWNCSADQLERHAAIVEWCIVRYRSYLKPSVMLGVMQTVWSSKIINTHQWQSVYMVHGILRHWADMVTLALPAGDAAHVDPLPSGSLQDSADSKEMLQAINSVKLHLGDFSRLCLSLGFDIVWLEIAEEVNTGSPEAQVVKRMWQTVVCACSSSLRILVNMYQQMTELVQGNIGEREVLVVVRLATRLLQCEDLATVWGKDRGEAVTQLQTLQATVVKYRDDVSAHQWWSDFVYAVSILKQQLNIC